MSNLAQEVQKTAYLQEIARVMNVIAILQVFESVMSGPFCRAAAR